MCQLVNDPSYVLPFIDRLAPGLERAAEEMTDANAARVVRQTRELLLSNVQAAESFAPMDPPQIRAELMKIIKQAAVHLGEDPKHFGSHSIRRGAATCYLSVMPYEWVRMHGRWRSDCAREYIELMGDEAKDFIRLVVAGKRLPRLVPTTHNPQVSRPHRARDAWVSGGIRSTSCRAPQSSGQQQ